MHCTHCGQEIPNGSRICPNCGEFIETYVPPHKEGVPAWRIGLLALMCAAASVFLLAASAVHVGLVEIPIPDIFRDDSQVEEPEDVQWAVEAKNMVDTYSWEDLAAISAELREAPTTADMVMVARHYNILDENGRLNGNQTKRFELIDGTELTAQIIGIGHDERADGNGRAGISFLIKECVTVRDMNANGNIEGGWRQSDLRKALEETYLPMLPSDLAGVICAVNKRTNNVGTASEDSVDVVTKTSEKLWVPSTVEVIGRVNAADLYTQHAWAAPIYNAEGTRYQLFEDIMTMPNSENTILIRRVGSAPTAWWLRSPRPGSQHTFCTVDATGNAPSGDGTAYAYGLVFGFCI